MKTYRKAIYMRIFVEAGRRVYYTVNSAVRTGHLPGGIRGERIETGVSHNTENYMHEFTFVSHLSGIIPDRDKRRNSYHV